MSGFYFTKHKKLFEILSSFSGSVLETFGFKDPRNAQIKLCNCTGIKTEMAELQRSDGEIRRIRLLLLLLERNVFCILLDLFLG